MDKDVKTNVSNAIKLITQASEKGAKIICLPELFNTLYFCQAENDGKAKKLAEPDSGYTISRLSRIAKKMAITILAPIYEISDDGEYYNTVFVIGEDGQVIDAYRKMHIPHDPLFYERDYFKESTEGIKVIETKHARIAPLICFDQWFPEVARIAALKGADIIFYPTAIGYIKDYQEKDNWLDAWITIQRSHAISNNVYVAAINRVGNEGRLKFWGSSFVCDPFGKILVKGSSGKEKVLLADIDFSENERVREGWGFFAKRRPSEYGLLANESIRDVKKKSPSELGYAFPAEWESHSAVLLAWPHDTITFPNLKETEKAYVKIIHALEGNEQIQLMVTGRKMKDHAVRMLKAAGIDVSTIRFFEHDYADVWFRDYGPTYVVNRDEKKLAMVKWTFNAYGEKYETLMKDDDVPIFLNKNNNLPYFDSGIVLEGGSIDTNGHGTILTTRQCLLSKDRNKKLTQREIEKILKDFLSVSKIIWLNTGLKNDDTDGHIDNLARFVNRKTILCSFEENTKDANYKALKENYDILVKAVDGDGKRFNVVKLPVPRFYYDKRRLAASYTNFYIANNTVIVPQFNVKEDQKAVEIISQYFKGRKIIGIDCSEVICGGGTLHCISQQIPKI
jgi:agmatine deiminase